MKRTTNRLMALGMAGCLALAALAGCSAPAQEPAPEPAKEAYGIAIGSEGEDTVTILVANDAGQPVTAVAARTVEAAVAPDASAEAAAFEPLPLSAEAWEPGQVAALFVNDPQKVADEAEGAAEQAADAVADEGRAASDIIVAATVDLQVTLADGSTYVLHQIGPDALAKVEDVALHVDGEAGVAYLTYAEGGAEVSTLMAETQAAEAEKALAEAAANAAAAADAAADQAVASVSAAPSGASAASTYDEVPSGGSAGAPAQSEDSCVAPDDIVLN